MRNPEIRILLHNIRSAHNVGAIFRTSDAIGVSQVYLSGYSPLPNDKFGRPIKEIAKTALGSEQSITWEGIKNPGALIKKLKGEGFVVAAVEQDARAIDYKKFHVEGNILILVGNEVRGLSSAMKGHANEIIEIPMKGKKESLNVAVAYGIAMFRLFDK